MTTTKKPFLAVGLVVVLAWGVWNLIPDEERIIRRDLTRLAATASFSANESALARLAYASKLRDFLDADIEVNLEFEGIGTHLIQGRAETVQFATLAREKLKQAKFQLPDITVKLAAEGNAATAYMTLLADISGEKNAISQELKMQLKKTEGRWLITRVETLRTLQ